MEFTTQIKNKNGMKGKNLFDNKLTDYVLALTALLLLAITVYYGFPGPVIK